MIVEQVWEDGSDRKGGDDNAVCSSCEEAAGSVTSEKPCADDYREQNSARGEQGDVVLDAKALSEGGQKKYGAVVLSLNGAQRELLALELVVPSQSVTLSIEMTYFYFQRIRKR